MKIEQGLNKSFKRINWSLNKNKNDLLLNINRTVVEYK